MTAWLTVEDEQNYGRELLDVSQRAALHALAPAVQNLEQQNAELRRGLAVEARRNLDAAVERAIPNYREIDRDPGWHRWLLGVDTYTGQPRQALLNIAIADGSAARVVALFNGFLRESGGSHAASPASSGRTRSSGNKPIYTRSQVAALYSAHQKGAYTGREQEWARQEHDIIAAGREGRILGATDVAGK
jgi:hypothetical protein